MNLAIFRSKETLENPGDPRDNLSVIAGLACDHRAIVPQMGWVFQNLLRPTATWVVPLSTQLSAEIIVEVAFGGPDRLVVPEVQPWPAGEP